MLLYTAQKFPSRGQVVSLITTTSLLILYFVYQNYGLRIKFLIQSRVMSTIEPNCKITPLEIVDTTIDDSNNTPPSIPNIIHYVWLVEGREKFSVDFKTFVSVYSASIYFQPDVIYIHTDASPDQIDRARGDIHDESTRWTLNIPKVVCNQITPPQHTSYCRKILQIQHKSDFVRTQQLYEHGGIYMDTDILALRDVKILRESGFANIMGLEEANRVNNGFMMARKGSALLAIFRAEQHRVFDNRWTTHSVNLLTALSYRLQAVPGEVLIMGLKVFSPSSWTKQDIDTLFKPHDETQASLPAESHGGNGDGEAVLRKVPTSFQDAVNYWTIMGNEDRAEWEIDYSGSYVIHAFDGKPPRYWPKQVSLEYVMARQSNYARVAYPAVKHAMDAGVIDRKPR